MAVPPRSQRRELVAKAPAVASIVAFGGLATAMAINFFQAGGRASMVTYLLLAFIWAALAGWLAVALAASAISVRGRDLQILRPAILLSASAGNLILGGFGLALTVFESHVRMPEGFPVTIVLVFLTVGLLLSGIAGIEFRTLASRLGRIAALVASIQGGIAMALAYIFLYAAFFVTGRLG